MTVRNLDLLDLPFLSRFRQDILPLDNARCLTRGNPLSMSTLLSYLNPRRNLYTALVNEAGAALMGQVLLNEGETSARLTFMAPGQKVEELAPSLLDHLAVRAGEWGALHVLAEVDEDSPAFEALRQAGFAMYAWQRVWRLPRFSGRPGGSNWRVPDEIDWLAVQALHAQIVPALLQPVENLPRLPAGLVWDVDNYVQASAIFSNGPQGVWLQPLVLPDSGCFPAHVPTLVRAAGGWNQVAVFVCVRSYQTWLEAPLEELGAEPGERQAVMVKRLAKSVKEMQASPALEKALAKAKTASPATRREQER